MPRGQKTCPKCNNGVGPRTKVCDKCGHIFIFDKKDKEKEEKIDEFLCDIDHEKPVSTKHVCIWCGKDYDYLEPDSNVSYVDNPYWKKMHNIRRQYENYCDTYCILESVYLKDKVLIQTLNRLKKESLPLAEVLFGFEESTKLRLVLRDLLIRDYNRYSKSEKKTSENEENEEEEDSIHEELMFALEQAIEVGLRIPPRIEDVREIQNKEVEELTEGAEILRRLRNKNKGIEEEEEEEIEEVEEEKPLPQSSLMSRLLNKQLETKPVINNGDAKPGRGQKKCARCGSIVGVRTKICSCGYEF